MQYDYRFPFTLFNVVEFAFSNDLVFHLKLVGLGRANIGNSYKKEFYQKRLLGKLVVFQMGEVLNFLVLTRKTQHSSIKVGNLLTNVELSGEMWK